MRRVLAGFRSMFACLVWTDDHAHAFDQTRPDSETEGALDDELGTDLDDWIGSGLIHDQCPSLVSLLTMLWRLRSRPVPLSLVCSRCCRLLFLLTSFEIELLLHFDINLFLTIYLTL